MIKFFESQKEQSLVKSTIVEHYFDVWSKIISTRQRVSQLAYIDLYSGPGIYKNGDISTPIKITNKCISSTYLHDKIKLIFNDANKDYIEELRYNIMNLPDINLIKNQPKFINIEVDDKVADIFSNISMIPSFSFIDPFGYKGLSYRLIIALTKNWGCDCLFFFNLNRIRAAITNSKVKKHMDALFSEELAEILKNTIGDISKEEKDPYIVNELCALLSDDGKNFILPFKFISCEKDCTSHYLIFVSKNQLAYEIMKDIMYKQSSEFIDGVSTFCFIPTRDVQLSFLEPLNTPLEDLERELLTMFAGKKISMENVYHKHNVNRPFIKSNYKDVLLKLETENKIITSPPASKRRNYKGRKSMSDNVLIAFPPL